MSLNNVEYASIDELDDDETTYRLTEHAIMQTVLEEFGINVSLTMAKAIFTELFECLERSGYVVREDKS